MLELKETNDGFIPMHEDIPCSTLVQTTKHRAAVFFDIFRLSKLSEL